MEMFLGNIKDNFWQFLMWKNGIKILINKDATPVLSNAPWEQPSTAQASKTNNKQQQIVYTMHMKLKTKEKSFSQIF